MTQDLRRFRLPSSSMDNHESTALYHSRKANIRKYVWPEDRRKQQLLELDTIVRRVHQTE